MTGRDHAAVRDGLRLLLESGSVAELRILHTRRGTVSGYFDDLEQLARAAVEWSGKAPAVYVTANPVKRELLARASNRVREYARATTGDRDVVRRRWLLLDFDAARPAGISSTEAEHAAALARARACRDWLRDELGFAAGSLVLADSGNGGHTLARVDLPNDEASRRLLERCLAGVAFQWSDVAVAVDQGVANAARIWKVYGTLAAKGDGMPERPHRVARILEAPMELAVAPHPHLERLAALAPTPLRAATSAPRSGGEFDLETWIARHGLAVLRAGPWSSGHRWLLEACPFNADHRDGSVALLRFTSGAVAFRCLHNGCTGKDWRALRDLLEPAWRDGRGTRSGQEGGGGTARADTTRHADEREAAAPAGPWAAACAAPDFVNTDEPEVDFLEPNVLAPGSVTMLMSPRGLGKTHVAYAWAIRLARAGRRVLLLDRDNSRREIRRRLRAWGAGGADTATLKVMTRDEVPPLTDAAAWHAFPFREYDLVIVDSLDASTEGVGEKDSAKPSKALAPMLDIAHRAEGPAILVLGNAVKSAEHARGSGVNEDRADVVYELRDATGVAPSGTKPWWQELPEAGAGAWAARAERRKRRDTYRLAFVPSKFRIGEEPEPFVLEVDLAGAVWSLRDVTAEMLAAGREATEREQQTRRARQEAAADALAAEVRRRPLDKPINRTEAATFLKSKGVPRDDARALLDAEAGRRWRIEYVGGQGGGYALRPVTENGAAQINTPPGNPRQAGLFGEGISAARVPPDGTNQAVPKAAPAADSGAPPLVRASIDADRGNGQGENPHGAMASAQASAEREALAARGVLLSRAGRAGYPSVELRYGDSVPAGREAWELFATGGTAEDVAAAGAWLDHVSGEPAGEDDVA